MKQKDIDWTAIETEYITGRMSYSDLAADKDISLSAIKDHGKQGEWQRKRAEHRQDCTARAADKVAEATADTAAALQGLISEAALTMARELNRRLACCHDIKPSELLQLARVWQILNDSQKDEKDETNDTTHYPICWLPLRTDIDEPEQAAGA